MTSAKTPSWITSGVSNPSRAPITVPTAPNAPNTAVTFRCTFPWRQCWNAEIAAVTATIPRLMAMADFGSILR